MNSELRVGNTDWNGSLGSEATDSRLEALHRWARSQQFNPPFWLRQPDLQTAWYVIRDIAARVQHDRISTRQVWAHVWGEERPPASTRSGKLLQSRAEAASGKGQTWVEA